MILLENGANFNPCDKRGNTPLHFCCNNGHMDSATLLMIVSTKRPINCNHNTSLTKVLST